MIQVDVLPHTRRPPPLTPPARAPAASRRGPPPLPGEDWGFARHAGNPAQDLLERAHAPHLRRFAMSVNSFGRLFRFTSWGESHGPAIGAGVDGCPPGLRVDEAAIQHWLDKRRPGASALTSARAEPDRVRILSGVYEGRTTGTPISLVIDNVDARPGDYAGLAPRPGHADRAYEAKYGL